MTFINYASREINCKIVYYGPGLGGKTTNLQYIYSKTAPETKGKMISLATETDRTLFFDFLPLDLGSIATSPPASTSTVPGQVFCDASRKLILKGVDGVVFVADSGRRMDANIESIHNLDEEPARARLRHCAIPYALQFSKRDLPSALPVDVMYRTLNFKRRPTAEAVASEGRRLRHPQGGGKQILVRTSASSRRARGDPRPPRGAIGPNG